MQPRKNDIRNELNALLERTVSVSGIVSGLYALRDIKYRAAVREKPGNFYISVAISLLRLQILFATFCINV